jgi:hypothetical protein
MIILAIISILVIPVLLYVHLFRVFYKPKFKIGDAISRVDEFKEIEFPLLRITAVGKKKYQYVYEYKNRSSTGNKYSVSIWFADKEFEKVG